MLSAVVAIGCLVRLSGLVSAQTVRTLATYHNVGVEVDLTTDPGSATVRMFLRGSDSELAFREVHPLSRLTATAFAGSAFDLASGTSYDLRLISTAFTRDWEGAFVTRSEVFPQATNRTYHVSALTGDDDADGLSGGTAWATLGRALDAVQPGDRIWLYEGRYFEGDLRVPRSGTESAPIVIENAPEASPVLDGTDKTFVAVWTVDDVGRGIYRAPCEVAPRNAYLNGEHFFHYLDVEDLRQGRWEQPGG